MLNTRLMVLSGVTFAAVLGIGFSMQNGITARHWQSDISPVAAADEADLVLQDITLTSTAPMGTRLSAERDSLPEKAMPVDGSCTVTAQASAAPMANVNLEFSAPCHANERVTVHHSGLMFTGTTDGDGHLSVLVPALTTTAVYIVELASGSGAVATAQVNGLDQVDRVALQWTGNSGFEIHAREFGAEYGQAGHIWSGVDNPSRASQVLRLGDAHQLAPRMVEVYSFVREMADSSGTVALSIEAEVSAINCGREISAQTLELRDHRKLKTRDLVLSMPNCNAIGDFLVLNNLVEDLRIVAN